MNSPITNRLTTFGSSWVVITLRMEDNMKISRPALGVHSPCVFPWTKRFLSVKNTKSPHSDQLKVSTMEGVWTLHGISNFVTSHSFWEMGPRKYSGFLRYNLRTKAVSVYLNPYGGANCLTVLTRYDHTAANYLIRVNFLSKPSSR